MPIDLYGALLTLYASSSAVGMAYLALPDYRYRNAISEYMEFQVRRRFSHEEKLATDRMDGFEVEAAISRCVERHKSKPNGVPDWLDTLTLILYLPRGHVPNETDPLKKEKKKDCRPNWFQKIPGRLFRSFYLTHWDNKIVTFLATISLAITVWILCDIVFTSPGIALENVPTGAQLPTDQETLEKAANDASVPEGIISQWRYIFFGIGVIGLVAPAIIAAIGRLFICPSAREDINVAVRELIGNAVEADADYWIARALPKPTGQTE